MEVAGLGDERALGAETKRQRWDWLWSYGVSGVERGFGCARPLPFLLNGMDGRAAYKPRHDGPVGFSSIQTSRSIRYRLFTQTVFSLCHLNLAHNLSHHDDPNILHGDVRHGLARHPSRVLWQRWRWEYPYVIHSCLWLVHSLTSSRQPCGSHTARRSGRVPAPPTQ